MTFKAKRQDSAPSYSTIGEIKIGAGLMLDQYGVLHLNHSSDFNVDSSTGIFNYGNVNNPQGHAGGVIPLAVPTIDPLNGKCLVHIPFNVPYAESYFTSTVNNTTWQIISDNAYGTGEGGAFDNLGTVYLGKHNLISYLSINSNSPYRPKTVPLNGTYYSNDAWSYNVFTGTQNFCIEAWFYPTGIPDHSLLFALNSVHKPAPWTVFYDFISTRQASTTFSPVALYLNADGSLELVISSQQVNAKYSYAGKRLKIVPNEVWWNNTVCTTDYYEGKPLVSGSSAAGVMTTNNWYHVALCRGLDRFTVFVNGVIALDFSDKSDTGVKYNIAYGSPHQGIGDLSLSEVHDNLVLGSELVSGYPDNLPIFTRTIDWGTFEKTLPPNSQLYSANRGSMLGAFDYDTMINDPARWATYTAKFSCTPMAQGEIVISGLDLSVIAKLIVGKTYQLKFFDPLTGTDASGQPSMNGTFPSMLSFNGMWTVVRKEPYTVYLNNKQPITREIGVPDTPTDYIKYVGSVVNSVNMVNFAEDLFANITSLTVTDPVPSTVFSDVDYIINVAPTVTVKRTITFDTPIPLTQSFVSNLTVPTLPASLQDNYDSTFSVRGSLTEATQTVQLACTYTDSNGVQVDPIIAILSLLRNPPTYKKNMYVGLVDELRVTMDTPRYFDNFDPPAVPFKEV